MAASAAPPRSRLLIGLGAGALAVISAAGITQLLLFSQPSALKYLVTIGGALVVLALSVVRDPLAFVVPLIVLTAPFAEATATFAGLTVSVVWPLLALGVAAGLAEAAAPGRTRSALGTAAVLALGLLIVPVGLGGPDRQAVTIMASIVIAAWLAASLAARPGGIAVVVSAIAGSVLHQAGLAIYQVKTGEQFNLYGGPGTAEFGRSYFFTIGDEFRPVGGLADPISLGNVLALGLPSCIAIAVLARTALARLGGVVATAVVGLALVLTFSRMSWFGGVAGLLAAIALLPSARRLRAVRLTLAVGATVVATAFAISGDTLADRFEGALDPTKQGLQTARGDRLRLQLWDAAARTATANPVAGIGFGRIRSGLAESGVDLGPGSHAHSTYLQVAAEAGTAGVIALLVILVALFIDLRRGRRGPAGPWTAAIAGAAVAMIVVWLTDYAVGYLPVAAFVGVVFGAGAGASRAMPEAQPRRKRWRVALGLVPSTSSAPQSGPDFSQQAEPGRSSTAAGHRRPGHPAGARTRVVMIANSVTPDRLGGSNRYVRELSAALVQLGVDVEVVTKRVDPTHPPREVGDDGVRIARYRVPAKDSPLFAATYPAAVLRGVVAALRRQGQSAVVHSHFPLPALVLAGLNRPYLQTFQAPGYREVLSERQESYALPPALHSGVVSAFRQMEVLVNRRATRCVVLSEFMRSELRRLAPRAADAAALVPGGLDLHRFSPGERIADAWAADASPLLFTARRLTPRTGVVQLVAAMPAILERLPEARLAIAGMGDMRAEIEAEIARLDVGRSVRLLGRISDDELVRWYRSARLVVIPTQELEGFGLVTAEALACGTPVVGTPAGATPELLEPLSRRLITRDNSPPALAAAIVDVATDASFLAEIRANARSRVAPDMGWDAIAHRYLALYGEVARASR